MLSVGEENEDDMRAEWLIREQSAARLHQSQKALKCNPSAPPLRRDKCELDASILKFDQKHPTNCLRAVIGVGARSKALEPLWISAPVNRRVCQTSSSHIKFNPKS